MKIYNVLLLLLPVIILILGCTDGRIINPAGQQVGYGTIRISLPVAGKSVPTDIIKANADEFKFVVYNDAGYLESLTIHSEITGATAEFYIPAGIYRLLVTAQYDYLLLASGNAIDVQVFENQVTNQTVTLLNVEYDVVINSFPAQVTCGTQYTLSLTPQLIQEGTGFFNILDIYDNWNLMTFTNTGGTYSLTETAPSSPGTRNYEIFIHGNFIDPYYSSNNALCSNFLYNANSSPQLSDDVVIPNSLEYIAGSTPTGLNIAVEWGF